MISSKFTDKFIRFLSAFTFLVILLYVSQTFAGEPDISDIIEQELSNDRDNLTKPESPGVKDEAINSAGENAVNEKLASLPKADKAKLIVLNKITTKSSEHILKVGKKQPLGNLSIEVHKCVKATDPYNSNNWMLLTIFDNKIEGNDSVVFHGWVLTSNQSLSTLEHPVYEVIPRDCIASDK